MKSEQIWYDSLSCNNLVKKNVSKASRIRNMHKGGWHNVNGPSCINMQNANALKRGTWTDGKRLLSPIVICNGRAVWNSNLPFKYNQFAKKLTFCIFRNYAVNVPLRSSTWIIRSYANLDKKVVKIKASIRVQSLQTKMFSESCRRLDENMDIYLEHRFMSLY